MRRLRERQQLSLAVPVDDQDAPVADIDCFVLLTESDTAFLQTVDMRGTAVEPIEGTAVIGFVHDGRPVMLRGTAEKLTPALFRFRVSDGIGVPQLRGSTRVQVRMPVVVAAEGTADVHGFTVDLSRTGALLEVLAPAVDRDLNVTLALPDGGSPLKLVGRPVRSTLQGVAVHFVDPAPEASRRLESLILTEKARALWASLAGGH
jgi:PilZ domain